MLELKGWRVTKTDLITICNGQWIGSEVSGIVDNKLFNEATGIRTFCCLLKNKEKRPCFFNTILYQRWLSFLQKSNGKISTSKSNKRVTEHPCNEIMVGWPSLHRVK